MKNSQLLKSSALCITLILPVNSFAGIVVVANKDFPAASLNMNDVKDLFLGKKLSVSDVKVTPIDQKDGPLRQEFDQKILNKTDEQLTAYWSRLLFTGQGTPPDKVGGNNDVVSAVSNTAGSIGYVEAASVTSDVKVVFTAP